MDWGAVLVHFGLRGYRSVMEESAGQVAPTELVLGRTEATIRAEMRAAEQERAERCLAHLIQILQQYQCRVVVSRTDWSEGAVTWGWKVETNVGS